MGTRGISLSFAGEQGHVESCLGVVVLSCATMVALTLAVTAVQAQPGSEAARLNCFMHPDGTTISP